MRAAGVTRGALYHHFDGKPELLEAVYEQVEGEITEKIATGALAGSDPLEALRAGAEMFLDACLEPEVQRIVLLDAPAVLGLGALARDRRRPRPRAHRGRAGGGDGRGADRAPAAAARWPTS